MDYTPRRWQWGNAQQQLDRKAGLSSSEKTCVPKFPNPHRRNQGRIPPVSTYPGCLSFSQAERCTLAFPEDPGTTQGCALQRLGIPLMNETTQGNNTWAEQAIGYRRPRRVEVWFASLWVSLSQPISGETQDALHPRRVKTRQGSLFPRHSTQPKGNHGQPQEIRLLHQAKKNYDVDTSNLPTNPTPMPECALFLRLPGSET